MEGKEEEAFFDVVKMFGVHPDFELTIKCANGYGNIDSLYQFLLPDQSFDCILCVYDVDYRQNEPSSPYRSVRSKLYRLLGDEKAVDAISICMNPNILQAFLLGCGEMDEVSLKTSSKRENTPIIHRYWDEIGRERQNEVGQKISSPYEASAWQLKRMKESFEYGEYSYETLLGNMVKLSLDYLSFDHPGGNILPLLLALRNGDFGYFNQKMAYVR